MAFEMKHHEETGPPNPLTRKQQDKKKKRFVLIGTLILSIILWGSLAYGGYYLANNYIQDNQKYIESKVKEVKAFNEEKIAELNKKLNGDITNVRQNLSEVKKELTAIKVNLKMTEDVITGANNTKKSLQQNINELNAQLEQLKKAIKRLEDASR